MTAVGLCATFRPPGPGRIALDITIHDGQVLPPLLSCSLYSLHLTPLAFAPHSPSLLPTSPRTPLSSSPPPHPPSPITLRFRLLLSHFPPPPSLITPLFPYPLLSPPPLPSPPFLSPFVIQPPFPHPPPAIRLYTTSFLCLPLPPSLISLPPHYLLPPTLPSPPSILSPPPSTLLFFQGRLHQSRAR